GIHSIAPTIIIFSISARDGWEKLNFIVAIYQCSIKSRYFERVGFIYIKLKLGGYNGSGTIGSYIGDQDMCKFLSFIIRIIRCKKLKSNCIDSGRKYYAVGQHRYIVNTIDGSTRNFKVSNLLRSE